MSAVATTPLVGKPEDLLASVGAMTPAAKKLSVAKAPHKKVDMGAFSLQGGNINALAAHCNIPLALLAYISHEKPTSDVSAITTDISQALAQLEHDLDKLESYDSMTKKSAHYCICAMADGVLAAHSQDVQGDKSSRFLQTYYGVQYQQRGIYDVALRLLSKPEQYREVLELIYLCLNLSFDQLQDGRDAFYAEKRLSVLSKIQGSFSDDWQAGVGLQTLATRNVVDKPYRIKVNLPIWPIYALTPIALLCVYWFFNRDLNQRLIAVFELLKGFN